MQPTIGFIGLGAMGGPMATNLLAAGYSVTAYDPDAERLGEMAVQGADPTADTAEAVRAGEIIMTSLPNSATFVEVADRALLPEARREQTFIGLGTVEPGEVRRLAPEFEARGARLLDVPVSGGPHGARDGTLRMFAGGEREVFDACRPVLEVLGDPERIVYCGPSGTGQVVKGVNQMAAGLSNAAFLEAAVFGVLGGADPDAIRRGIGGESGWRGAFNSIAERVVAGEAEYVGVKHGQLPYFLAEAEENGFELPLARALHAFCEGAPEIVREANRMSPSFWRELTERAG